MGANVLHSKPYDEACAVAEKLVEGGILSEDDAIEVLETHPDNPDKDVVSELADEVAKTTGSAEGSTVTATVAVSKYATKADILAALQSGELPVEEASKLLDGLSAKKIGKYCKVSAGGGLSVYGFNRTWPVTLGKWQWLALAEFLPEILEFIKEHSDEMAQSKDDTRFKERKALADAAYAAKKAASK